MFCEICGVGIVGKIAFGGGTFEAFADVFFAVEPSLGELPLNVFWRRRSLPRKNTFINRVRPSGFPKSAR